MPDDRPLRILLLEDNPGDATLLKEAFRAAKVQFELTHFVDGEAAITYITSGRAAIDLAVLDLNVPKRDGLEVLEAIRTQPGLGGLAVVILSSSPQDHLDKKVTGADSYIEKPPTLDAFLAIGKEIMNCYSQTRQHPPA